MTAHGPADAGRFRRGCTRRLARRRDPGHDALAAAAASADAPARAAASRRTRACLRARKSPVRRIALWLAAFALAGTLVLALGVASARADAPAGARAPLNITLG